MNKKADRGQATRDRLVAVATALFAGQGYEETSIEGVLHAAGVSRGALYHHFGGKEALFEAVLEAVEIQVGVEMRKAVEGLTDPVEALRVGGLAWIRLAGDPVVQRIVLIDAPSVLGWQRWRQIEEEHALGMTKAALSLVAAEGHLPAALVDPFAHMLLAALNEIAIVIARSPDGDAALRDGTAAVEELLRRILR